MTVYKKKLCVVGDFCCGHYPLIWYMDRGEPLPQALRDRDCRPVRENSVATVHLGPSNITVELSLWDVIENDDYARLRPLSYPDTDVVLVCFSFDSTDSLENAVQKWLSEVKQYCPKVPYILLGTNVHLKEDQATVSQLAKTNKNMVSSDAAKKIADQIGSYAYHECSSVSGQGIDELLRSAAQAALSHRETSTRKCILT